MLPSRNKKTKKNPGPNAAERWARARGRGAAGVDRSLRSEIINQRKIGFRSSVASKETEHHYNASEELRTRTRWMTSEWLRTRQRAGKKYIQFQLLNMELQLAFLFKDAGPVIVQGRRSTLAEVPYSDGHAVRVLLGSGCHLASSCPESELSRRLAYSDGKSPSEHRRSTLKLHLDTHVDFRENQGTKNKGDPPLGNRYSAGHYQRPDCFTESPLPSTENKDSTGPRGLQRVKGPELLNVPTNSLFPLETYASDLDERSSMAMGMIVKTHQRPDAFV
ncbi:hypothetical protein EV421DRAFT_1741852 [Armillaria borealis]|uniref:Uncharacterized protein n=1 Tax=Armillaria borealis TaxID=47425 RepID=A0AA39MGL9_9AGAR|nr:hypothetical protein EV421DRAFT_1741852 [Armillaria borealis]